MYTVSSKKSLNGVFDIFDKIKYILIIFGRGSSYVCTLLNCRYIFSSYYDVTI